MCRLGGSVWKHANLAWRHAAHSHRWRCLSTPALILPPASPPFTQRLHLALPHPSPPVTNAPGRKRSRPAPHRRCAACRPAPAGCTPRPPCGPGSPPVERKGRQAELEWAINSPLAVALHAGQAGRVGNLSAVVGSAIMRPRCSHTQAQAWPGHKHWHAPARYHALSGPGWPAAPQAPQPAAPAGAGEQERQALKLEQAAKQAQAGREAPQARRDQHTAASHGRRKERPPATSPGLAAASSRNEQQVTPPHRLQQPVHALALLGGDGHHGRLAAPLLCRKGMPGKVGQESVSCRPTPPQVELGVL